MDDTVDTAVLHVLFFESYDAHNLELEIIGGFCHCSHLNILNS